MTDAPMPLQVAVKQCFPHGGATVNTLRAAIRSGDLNCAIVGRSFLVTIDDIEKWMDKCRARQKDRGSTSRGYRADRQSMSSATDRMRLAQDALQAMLTGQEKNSRPTSSALSGPKQVSAT